MSIEYERAPRPAPLWALPLTVAVLALGLLWFLDNHTSRDIRGFGGSAQPETPIPTRLADGSALPEVPEPLKRRFGDDVVVAKSVEEVPDEVEKNCRNSYEGASRPDRQRLHDLIQSSTVNAMHLGPEALTSLSIAVDESPPGYPAEVAVACMAWPGDDGWESKRRPHLDFALDGRPGVRRDGPGLHTRMVQVAVGARWAVEPRGGWWLAYDVQDTSWLLMTLTDAITDETPLRVVFVDETGAVVADRPVGPTRSATLNDHSADVELVAGDVPAVLERLERGPMRTCEPGDITLCVWLAFNDQEEVLGFAGFGPHPLDTPPLGYIGYCPEADMFQGSVTSARFRTDGTWAGGPGGRGLDRYGVRFEAGKVVVDLSEHVVGEPAEGDPVKADEECVFATKGRGEPAS